MYCSIGFVLAIVLMLIIMSLLFIKSGRDFLEDRFYDYELGDQLKNFRLFTEGRREIITGMFGLFNSFMILLMVSLVLFVIMWIFWPLIVGFIIYFSVFIQYHKDKIKKEKEEKEEEEEEWEPF